MTVNEATKVLPGGRVLFKDIDLAFLRGAKVGVVGLNGSGKSSLFRILAGTDREFDGKVWSSDGIRVGYLEQEPVLDPAKDVHGNIMDGLREKTQLLKRFEELSESLGDPDCDFDKVLAEQAEVQDAIEAAGAWALEHTVDIAKTALRVPVDDADVSALSGGERRRVALCRLLLEEPDVLLLDEPTNHLDAQSVRWLEEFLASYTGTVIAVTHDRYFLDNVAGWILEIDRGRMFPHEGNYSSWLEAKAARLALEDKVGKKRSAAMAAELAWIRKGSKGQQSKGKARKARYDALVEEAAADKAARKFQAGTIVIPPGPRLGRDVIKASGISKTVPNDDGTQRTLFKDVSFAIERGDIVGVVGGNGVGKTTLLKVLTGAAEADSGSVEVGDTVSVGFVTQARDALDGNRTVMDVVSDDTGLITIGDRTMDVRAYLSGFNLHDATAKKAVKLLSGGERNRVHLARTLAQPCNVLLLDEPTNDLDVDTLRSLEEALEGFPGSALIVSHDRYFLDRVATHILAFDTTGKVHYFPGNYSDFEAWAAKQGITTLSQPSEG